jgi:hypothetical protein
MIGTCPRPLTRIGSTRISISAPHYRGKQTTSGIHLSTHTTSWWVNNPAYVRACGFTLPDRRRGYRHSDTPSLRKLEQFDQIMTTAGLWHDLAVEKVCTNLREGLVTVGITVVHDTTHYPARSAMTAVEVPAPAEAPAPEKGRKPRRLHKLMKEDFGDERLSKRGNDAFQARLDKTRWAMHLLLAERKRR